MPWSNKTEDGCINDPANTFLGIHLRKIVYLETCILMFVEALLILAQNRKHINCPWTVESINKQWYIKEFYTSV